MFELVLKAHSLVHTTMLEAPPVNESTGSGSKMIPTTFCKYADLGADNRCTSDDVLRFNDALFAKMGAANGGAGESEHINECFYSAWQASGQGDITLDTYLDACGRGAGST